MAGFAALKAARNTAVWKRALAPFLRTGLRVARRTGEDDIALAAGGVAFYAFLSIFPAIACALMVWGLFTSETDLRAYFEFLNAFLPEAAYILITDQMERIAEAQSSRLSWGALASLVLALWSASRAANALLTAVAVTHERQQKRGFIRQNLIALAFTAGGIVFALLSLAAIGAVPPIIRALQLGAFADASLRIIRWAGLLGLFLGGIFIFYRIARPHGDDGAQYQARPTLPGTLVAGAIWLAASVGFSFYLGNFADYNETFGSLGAAVALLIWLWFSAAAICIGAETNAILSQDTPGPREQP